MQIFAVQLQLAIFYVGKGHSFSDDSRSPKRQSKKASVKLLNGLFGL